MVRSARSDEVIPGQLTVEEVLQLVRAEEEEKAEAPSPTQQHWLWMRQRAWRYERRVRGWE